MTLHKIHPDSKDVQTSRWRIYEIANQQQAKKLLQKHRCCLNKSCAKEKEKQRFTERWKRFEIMCD